MIVTVGVQRSEGRRTFHVIRPTWQVILSPSHLPDSPHSSACPCLLLLRVLTASLRQPGVSSLPQVSHTLVSSLTQRERQVRIVERAVSVFTGGKDEEIQGRI